jgi:hypothetical protein
MLQELKLLVQREIELILISDGSDIMLKQEMQFPFTAIFFVSPGVSSRRCQAPRNSDGPLIGFRLHWI